MLLKLRLSGLATRLKSSIDVLKTVLTTLSTAVVCLAGLALAHGQNALEQKPLMAEDVFKNVQVLKGIPVDEFMSTMGIFSAALGVSCENCHAANDSKWENYAGDNTEMKRTARRMVAMMSTINKSFFGGRQVVTCFSCHRGGDHPKTTPDLSALYGGPPEDELDDAVEQDPEAPSADQILDKYLEALGGAQRLTAITNLVARGTSSGYGPESGKRPIEVFAKAPAQRTMIIHTDNGDSTTAFDGRTGWMAGPLQPVPVLALTGGELEGIKLDATLAFPGQIKQALGQWRVGRPGIIDDRKVLVVQGSSSARSFATLYFDPKTGLLVRLRRYAASPVGRIPTQFDFSDYRDVNGVKMPFHWTMTWLDGRENVDLSEVQTNVPINAAKFGKPAPPAPPGAKRAR
jgi:photosynthetic reaction center cytochrome c subunit